MCQQNVFTWDMAVCAPTDSQRQFLLTMTTIYKVTQMSQVSSPTLSVENLNT